MKTDAKDFLFTTLLITFNVLTSLALLIFLKTPSAQLAGDLAPIVLFLAAMAIFGFVTAATLAALMRALPLKDGQYDANHAQFTLWKVQHVVAELGKVALSIFFPVFARSAFYAIFGARVGKQVAVAGKILDPRLTVLEDGCVLGEGCIVTSHTMWGEHFILGTVRVGARATVGVGCILMPGVSIGADAVVLPGSVLKSGTQIGNGETWGGVPALRLKAAQAQQA